MENLLKVQIEAEIEAHRSTGFLNRESFMPITKKLAFLIKEAIKSDEVFIEAEKHLKMISIILFDIEINCVFRLINSIWDEEIEENLQETIEENVLFLEIQEA